MADGQPAPRRMLSRQPRRRDWGKRYVYDSNDTLVSVTAYHSDIDISREEFFIGSAPVRESVLYGRIPGGPPELRSVSLTVSEKERTVQHHRWWEAGRVEEFYFIDYEGDRPALIRWGTHGRQPSDERDWLIECEYTASGRLKRLVDRGSGEVLFRPKPLSRPKYS